VWDAIALHTTPGIPQHKEPEVAPSLLASSSTCSASATTTYPPRIATPSCRPSRRGLQGGDHPGLCRRDGARPDTTFGTVNADVLAEKLPGYERPNFCSIIRSSKHDT